MNVKNPIVITSLEEDFKKIGLIKATPAAPVQESAESDESDELDEARRVKRRVSLKPGGGAKVVKTQRTSAKKRMQNKKYGRSAAGRKAKKRAVKRAHTSKGKRRAARVAALATKKGTRHEGFDPAEALKSFANAAIIAEKLQTEFLSWVKNDLCESAGDESEFLSLASELAALAEEFAEVATALSEGTELDGEAVTEMFNEGLQFILDSVDLYEANKSDDEEEADDEEGDESESDDSEEESDDEGEE